MTQEHPITPPPELVQQWLGDYFGCPVSGELSDSELYLATQAARWGADQELEACCEWVGAISGKYGPRLRLARRTKPPRLKEQPLLALSHLEKGAEPQMDATEAAYTVRRALESLPQ